MGQWRLREEMCLTVVTYCAFGPSAHEIDRGRTLLITPHLWGGPTEFEQLYFSPKPFCKYQVATFRGACKLFWHDTNNESSFSFFLFYLPWCPPPKTAVVINPLTLTLPPMMMNELARNTGGRIERSFLWSMDKWRGCCAL